MYIMSRKVSIVIQLKVIAYIDSLCSILGNILYPHSNWNEISSIGIYIQKKLNTKASIKLPDYDHMI